MPDHLDKPVAWGVFLPSKLLPYMVDGPFRAQAPARARLEKMDDRARLEAWVSPVFLGCPTHPALRPADDALRVAAIVAKNMADNASFNLNQAGLTVETAACDRAFVDIYRTLDAALKAGGPDA